MNGKTLYRVSIVLCVNSGVLSYFCKTFIWNSVDDQDNYCEKKKPEEVIFSLTYNKSCFWYKLGLNKGITSNVFHDHQRATPVLAQTPQYCRSLCKSSVWPQPLFAYEFKGLVMWFESCWLNHEAHFVNFVLFKFQNDLSGVCSC